MIRYYEEPQSIRLFQMQIVGCSPGEISDASAVSGVFPWLKQPFFLQKCKKEKCKNATTVTQGITSHGSWSLLLVFHVTGSWTILSCYSLAQIYWTPCEEKTETGMLKGPFISQLWLHVCVHSGASNIDLCRQGHEHNNHTSLPV